MGQEESEEIDNLHDISSNNTSFQLFGKIEEPESSMPVLNYPRVDPRGGWLLGTWKMSRLVKKRSHAL